MTVFHCHYELSWLIKQSDSALANMLKGGTPLQMRSHLVCERAKGKKALTIGGCDNLDEEGYCKGHPSSSEWTSGRGIEKTSDANNSPFV